MFMKKCNIQDSEQVKQVKNKKQLHHNIMTFHMSQFTNTWKTCSYFKAKFQICCILSNCICHVMQKPLLHSRKWHTVKYTTYKMDGNHLRCQKQPTGQLKGLKWYLYSTAHIQSGRLTL